MAQPITSVVFDLGGVLVDWNPRYLYRKLFEGDEAGMERFLTEVCSNDWHQAHDAGESFAANRVALKERFPAEAERIDAWGDRFPEMFGGEIAGTVAILDRLAARGVKLFALTNWPADFLPARLGYRFFDHFSDVVVSGVERMMKPDARIFRLLLERNGLTAAEAVYIDDKPENAAAATAVGFHGLVFTTPEVLEADLKRLGVL